MKLTKIEVLNGYPVRFFNASGDWWASMKDVCIALNTDFETVQKQIGGELVRLRFLPYEPYNSKDHRVISEKGLALLMGEI